MDAKFFDAYFAGTTTDQLEKHDKAVGASLMGAEQAVAKREVVKHLLSQLFS